MNAAISEAARAGALDAPPPPPEVVAGGLDFLPESAALKSWTGGNKGQNET